MGIEREREREREIKNKEIRNAQYNFSLPH